MIREAIDAFVQSRRQERPGPQTHWYPSSLGKCERAVILKRAGEIKAQPFDITTLRKFWMGDAVHDALKEAVEGSLDVVGHELQVRNEEFGVSGRIDTLIRTPEGLEVIEYKSINSKGFDRPLPQPAHVLQLGVYLTFPAKAQAVYASQEAWIEPEQYPVPDRGRLVYWSKDDAQIKEYTIQATDQLRGNVKQTLQQLTDYWNAYQADKTLPPVLPLIQKTDADGEPEFYVIGPKKGQPKTKLDWRISYCEFLGSGYCCGDRDAV